MENDAFYEITKKLPDSIKHQYNEIWNEYQNNHHYQTSPIDMIY